MILNKEDENESLEETLMRMKEKVGIEHIFNVKGLVQTLYIEKRLTISELEEVLFVQDLIHTRLQKNNNQ
jgi:hypothetical protein